MVIQVNFWLMNFCSWSDINGRLKTSLRGKPVTNDLCGQKHQQTSQTSVSWGRLYWLARLCFLTQYICCHCQIHVLVSNLDSEKWNNKCRLSWALACPRAGALEWIFQNIVFSYSCTITQTWRHNWDLAGNSEINQAAKDLWFYSLRRPILPQRTKVIRSSLCKLCQFYKGVCPSQRPHQTDYHHIIQLVNQHS